MSLTNITSNNCCGCRACEQICPTHCISMIKDDEGFMISQIDTNNCINCEKCTKVCPVINNPIPNQVLYTYAVQHKNDELLFNSSSGGAFRLLADSIIDMNGVVCGCILENNYATFSFATNKNQLIKMQGSKYVQSDTGRVFSAIKDKLDNGITVLFSGSPCQCAGLINYLGENRYENLYTSDFICHGMPSAWIFNEYINYLEKKSNCKINNIRFRDKSARGWGMWFSYIINKGNRKKKIIRNFHLDSYEYAFEKSMISRYLCYSCPFQGKRFTDFTFADYWGVELYHPEINRKKGVSVLCVNSEKGYKLFDSCMNNAYIIKSSIENAAYQNASLVRNEKRVIPDIRKTIYSDVKNGGWKKVEKTVLNYNRFWIYKIWYNLPHGIINRLRKK